jgi:hypothetical protein
MLNPKGCCPVSPLGHVHAAAFAAALLLVGVALVVLAAFGPGGPL